MILIYRWRWIVVRRLSKCVVRTPLPPALFKVGIPLVVCSFVVERCELFVCFRSVSLVLRVSGQRRLMACVAISCLTRSGGDHRGCVRSSGKQTKACASTKREWKTTGHRVPGSLKCSSVCEKGGYRGTNRQSRIVTAPKIRGEHKCWLAMISSDPAWHPQDWWLSWK